MFVDGDMACTGLIGILGMDPAGADLVLMPTVSGIEHPRW